MGMDVGGHKGGVKSEPNVVPMIDVMLVLLIIFMVVTPIIASGFQAKMPEGKNIEKRAEEDLDITLGIDHNGVFFLSTKDASGTQRVQAIAKVELERVLAEIYSRRTTDKILYFKADQQLDFAQVEEGIRIARKAGVRVLAAVTEEKRDPFGRAGR